MKIKKRIELFEEFKTLSKSKTVKPETANPTAENAATDVKTGIIKDVESIINNLKELSVQIKEDIDAAIDDCFSEIDLVESFRNEALNEATAGELMLSMFKDMKSMAKLSTSYKKMASTKSNLETDKKIFGLKFAEDKEEAINSKLDLAKEKINAAIKAESDPAKKSKMRIKRDAKIEQLKAQITKKVDRTKEDKDKKFDRDITDANSAITKLTNDNKITSPLVSARWDAIKLAIDRKVEDQAIAKERTAWDQFIEDPERIKKLEAAQEKRAKKEAQEDKERLKDSQERAARAQEELDRKIESTSGAEREALEKLKEWNSAFNELSSNMDITKDSSQEERNKAQDASDRLNRAQDALSAKTMKDAYGYEDDEEGDAALTDYTERESELQNAYKANKTEAGGSSNTEETEAGGSSNTEETEDGGSSNTEETEDELTDEQRQEIRNRIAQLEAKIASGESAKEGKPEDIQQRIEQSLAVKRQELQNLRSQLGESFGSYEKTMAILTEMESSIDAILREYDRTETITESFAFKSGSVADRFRSLM